MNTMLKSALITGGTFYMDNSVHHQVIRESSDRLHRATATAAFHNSDEKFDPPKCHPNTRLAVLSEIMKWIKWEGDLDSFIMWVYGPAGAGKSAIAQTIAEMCEEEMVLLASFFFSRNDPSRNSVKPFIATIAYQITFNIPGVRDAILAAVERDPLIFSKSLAFQLKSLIVEPLQPLVEAGFFNEPTSRRLVIIDGLDECSDAKVQQNIVEVLANAHQQHRLPLIFLFASRPEQHISLVFSTGILPSVTTRITLDESYLPDNDIRLFLTDKFQEIKSTHRLRAHLPPQWPLPDVLQQLVRKSSGQFVYASTVINYVSSIRHKPQDRLDIVLGIRPPQKDLPFVELDALYTHILASVEDIDAVLEILSVRLLCSDYLPFSLSSPVIEEFLSLQPGDVELYLGDLSSLVNVGCDQPIKILHASLSDFLTDPTRSKGFWINPPARYTAFSRRCLQLLNGTRDRCSNELVWLCYFNTTLHLQSSEFTPELHNDLIHFSFDNLQDFFKTTPSSIWAILAFIPPFLSGLRKLPFAEADHTSQLLQVDFDKMLGNILEKYYNFPGVALVLGALLEYTRIRYPNNHFPTTIASLYPLGTLYGTDFFEIMELYFIGGLEFLPYFVEFLENPERSKIHVFDQRRYVTASKECLQLCLCNHYKFSKGVTESVHRDNALRRNKPSLWRRRLGVLSRIRKVRHHLKVQRWKSSKTRYFESLDRGTPFPDNSPEHEYCRSVLYQWALDLFPSFLEKSAISLELAEVLRRRTFTTMGQRFPRRVRLAKEAIAKYLLRVEPGVGEL